MVMMWSQVHSLTDSLIHPSIHPGRPVAQLYMDYDQAHGNIAAITALQHLLIYWSLTTGEQ